MYTSLLLSPAIKNKLVISRGPTNKVKQSYKAPDPNINYSGDQETIPKW
jgi:hypothetical protein